MEDWSNLTHSNEAEARRRARILERYVALEPPSSEDDARFAEELGLSVDSLLRLAAAWRAHGSEALLRGGRRRRPPPTGEARQELLAEEIDMEGVAPARRDELLRRIRIVQSYLARGPAVGPTRLEAAARIGVSPTRFDALVREWSLHRRAALMPGAAVRGPRWYRRSTDRLRVETILRRIVRDAPTRTPTRTIHDELVAACAKEGLRPLGLSRTHTRVREMRGEALEAKRLPAVAG